MKTRSRWAAIGAAALVTALAAGCAGEASDPEEPGAAADMSLRIGHDGSSAVLPLKVAEAQGYFEAAGLEVELTQVDNIGTLPFALGTTFDIVQATPTAVISSNAQGIDIAGVAGMTVNSEENSTAGVVAIESSGVKSLADLAGKTVGTLFEGGTLDIATKFALQEAGVSPDDVTFVQVSLGAQADQLASGRVDAVQTIPPFQDLLMARGDTVGLGDPYLSLAAELRAMVWAAQTSWAAENPEAIEAFRTAMDQAIEYITANDADAKEVLQAYSGLDAEIVNATNLPNYTTSLPVDDFEVWLRAMEEVGGFTGSVDPADLVIS